MLLVGPPMSPHHPQMKFDVLGRLRNTKVPLHHAFLPLFEAVVNSIHSTQDRFGEQVGQLGKVDVRIHRVAQEALPGMRGPRPIEQIVSIEVADNGVGFTDANLDAFETADSTAKLERGGKGVGRFTWLVVFRSAALTSTFKSASGRLTRRSLTFRSTERGIEDYSEVEQPDSTDLRTSILLNGVNDRYAEPLRKGPEVIAEKLFEHCFNYFVLGRCPKISLQDDTATDAIAVNAKISEIAIDKPVALKVGNHELSVRHIRLIPSADRRHEVQLCANHRVVTTFPLSQVSDLGTSPLVGTDGEPRIHQVFVSGQSLDEAVDSTRTRLELPDGASLLEYGGALDLKTLRQAIGDYVTERLADVLKAEREDNLRRITRHIRTVQPEYRHLLTRRTDQLERVRWSDDAQQVDEALYRIQQGWEADVRRQQASVEQKLVEEKAELEKIADELHRVITETNEAGQANLVRYVVKRRAVLKLLTSMTSRFQGPALEKHVHQLVFPMRKTGDDVAHDDHNLWLVDDTLSFYEYLASDIPFSSNEAAPVDSRRRPDIIAFKTGDPFQHVAMVEFKRPDEDDDNPVQQLVEYAQLLRKGGAVDLCGRTLPGIDRNVRIDGYAIVTLTPKMEEKLLIAPGNIRKVENDWRWYGTVDNLNLTIEVLDFRAFLRRAEQRNRTFFAKLGMS
jgi:signal transduction histidine kinase